MPSTSVIVWLMGSAMNMSEIRKVMALCYLESTWVTNNRNFDAKTSVVDVVDGLSDAVVFVA